MAYITYTELITRYPVIATWNASSTNITNDVIAYAENELNSLLASHFTVPLAAHPTVKDLAMDLAYCRVWFPKDPKKAGEFRKAVYGRIESIKAGDEYIYTDSFTAIEPDGSGQEIWSTVQDYHPVHSMLGAESPYTHVSSDLLEALESERS